MSAHLVLDSRDAVGESPVWSRDDQALYWVDIVGSRIHRFEPSSGRHDAWPTPELPTSIGLRECGGFIVGLRRRVTLWSPDCAFETLAVPEPDKASNRLNEGAVAPDGSFWVGTMADNIGADGTPREIPHNLGALYRIASDGAVSRLTGHAFGITNTMVWRDDGSFVTADTLRNQIYLFDPALEKMTAFGPELGRGVPDGSTRDRAGTIFNARVGGGAALAKLSAEGALLGYIDLPITSPTSCAFGGPDLRTLYVTSARFGLTAEALGANPLEGGLFAIECDEPGLPALRFAG